MTRFIMPAFGRFIQEAEIIGRLLAGYGELEFEWFNCLSEALGGDSNKALRSIFRLKSEAQRLNIADALMQPYYDAIGLGGRYSQALGAIRFCKNIRNQYAHCHWLDFQDRGLYFTNLETAAESSEGEPALKFNHVDVPLLMSQEAYFCYTMDCLLYLGAESERLRAKQSPHPFHWPKTLPQPKLYNPLAEHPLPEHMTESRDRL